MFGNLLAALAHSRPKAALGFACAKYAPWPGAWAAAASRPPPALGLWLAERTVDFLRWPWWLLRAAPIRAQRLRRTWAAGGAGLRAFSATARQAEGLPAMVAAGRDHVRPAALWLAVLGTQVFDLLGGPEAAEIALRTVVRSTPLSAGEESAARALLGNGALSWQDVRVAEGGILGLAFRLNQQRAFTLWHTINLPGRGLHTRNNLPIVIHELVHVYQYEKVGSAYIPQALDAQHSTAGYGYGEAAGLQNDHAAGRRYHHYNREQQAQIVQDYFTLLYASTRDDHEEARRRHALACYQPCVADMRAGWL